MDDVAKMSDEQLRRKILEMTSYIRRLTQENKALSDRYHHKEAEVISASSYYYEISCEDIAIFIDIDRNATKPKTHE